MRRLIYLGLFAALMPWVGIGIVRAATDDDTQGQYLVRAVFKPVIWLLTPASNWMLGVGALLMRTETELILKSRRVTPGRLLRSGFTFQFPTWGAAASDLCRRWRDMNR